MASPTPFENHVIAITGAASGLGLGIAHYLAVRGAKLSLADVRKDALERAAASITTTTPGAEILVFEMDVRKSDQVRSWIQAIVDKFGKLTGAANMAGVTGVSIGKHTVKDVDEADWDFVMDVNLKGVFHCLQAELNAIEDGGSIVNAASIAGQIGMAKNSVYTASKHGVIGLTRSAAKECVESRVRVNAICPGSIETPMTANIASDWTHATVVKRKGTPEEIAALVAYLLGDESHFTTGAAYSIDGGWFC